MGRTGGSHGPNTKKNQQHRMPHTHTHMPCVLSPLTPHRRCVFSIESAAVFRVCVLLPPLALFCRALSGADGTELTHSPAAAVAPRRRRRRPRGQQGVCASAAARIKIPVTRPMACAPTLYPLNRSNCLSAALQCWRRAGAAQATPCPPAAVPAAPPAAALCRAAGAPPSLPPEPTPTTPQRCAAQRTHTCPQRPWLPLKN